MAKTPLLIVCSPFAKTGVSTTTRLIADYMKIEGRDCALFDTDPHSRALARWFPDTCLITDLSTTRGQIDLFDTIVRHGKSTRIVEVSSHVYARFFAQSREIGLFEEAVKNGLEPLVLFVSNGAEVAIKAAESLESVFRDLAVAPVVNQGPVRLGVRVHEHVDAFRARHSFLIPALDPSVRDIIENPRFSFSRFVCAGPPATMSLVVRAELRNFAQSVFTQFRAYDVRKAFDESTYLTKI